MPGHLVPSKHNMETVPNVLSMGLAQFRVGAVWKWVGLFGNHNWAMLLDAMTRGSNPIHSKSGQQNFSPPYSANLSILYRCPCHSCITYHRCLLMYLFSCCDIEDVEGNSTKWVKLLPYFTEISIFVTTHTEVSVSSSSERHAAIIGNWGAIPICWFVS